MNDPKASTDPEPPQEDFPGRRSRTREKEERVASETALKRLAEQLAGLRSVELEPLDLPEELTSALRDYQKIKSPAARSRHLRFLRSQLRDLDWLLVRRQVDQIKAGHAPASATRGETADWATTLAIHGDEGLGRFLTECPDADRSRLRQLIRNVRLAPEAKREKAERQLEALVDAALRQKRASER